MRAVLESAGVKDILAKSQDRQSTALLKQQWIHIKLRILYSDTNRNIDQIKYLTDKNKTLYTLFVDLHFSKKIEMRKLKLTQKRSIIGRPVDKKNYASLRIEKMNHSVEVVVTPQIRWWKNKTLALSGKYSN